MEIHSVLKMVYRAPINTELTSISTFAATAVQRRHSLAMMVLDWLLDLLLKSAALSTVVLLCIDVLEYPFGFGSMTTFFASSMAFSFRYYCNYLS